MSTSEVSCPDDPWIVAKKARQREILARLEAEHGTSWLHATPVTAEGKALAPRFRPVAPNQLKPHEHRVVKTVAGLLATHQDPREVLLEMAETHVADIAAMLECTLLEAWQEKRLAAVAVLPYIAKKQATEIDLNTRQQVDLTIVTEAATATLEGDVVEVVPNEPVAD